MIQEGDTTNSGSDEELVLPGVPIRIKRHKIGIDAGSDEELVLLPAEGFSREEQERQFAEPLHLEPDPVPAKWPQFSIGDLMIVMVGVAGGLAGGSWMPTDVFAAALGLATLVGLLVVSWYPPESHLGKLLWATLVIAYILAVLAAVLRPPVQSGA